MPLKPNDAERFYKELAEHYMEREGEQYRQELMQQPAILTPRLDSLMRTRLHRKNTVRWVSGAAAAAAALLLVVGSCPGCCGDSITRRRQTVLLCRRPLPILCCR